MIRLLAVLLFIAVQLAPSAVYAAESSPADTIYVVQPGDTLFRISVRFGTTVPALVAANQLPNANIIYVGQQLLIPGPGGVPAPGPTNPAPTSPSPANRYLVQRGDTLWRIGQRFGVTVSALMSANGLTSSLIFTGQTLIIPGPAAPPPAATPGPTPTRAACAFSWFFANAPASVCPAAAPAVTSGAAQQFEFGWMVWTGSPDTFYVLYGMPQGQNIGRVTLVQGPVSLAPGASVDNRVGGAPPGRFEPVSGFGLLWRGEIVGAPPLRSVLEWATAPEFSFQVTRQCEAYPNGYPTPTCYVRLPSGQIARVHYVIGFGYYW